MQPPIPPGTILQNRYCVTNILGQGGFGRTYLAEDQKRFNELCVLKEFMPSDQGTYALEKATELFQREAKVLYEIEHPQIPKFRENFEEDKRLFLVQDYVEGKTYATLLQERVNHRHPFEEAEVVQFLLQMLPVLEYIHSKGIIHRDISPDNIILRDRDRLPVLIDFGVVKAGIAKFTSVGKTNEGTVVGKLGYAPNEQLQTGTVYPNSDIYALAVTAVVLMTGRRPEALMDESTMTWRWHQWVPALNSWFAQLLNRMLSPRPNNRYQSATEVLQALRSLASLITAPAAINAKKTSSKSSLPTKVQAEEAKVKPPIYRAPQQHITVYTTPKTNPIGNSKWTLPIILSGIVLLITLGPILLISSMFPAKRLISVRVDTSLPVPTGSSSPSLSPNTSMSTGSSTPSPSPETLNLGVEQTISKEGNLKANQSITYVIPVQQGQQLSAAVTKGGVLITVLAPNKDLADFQAKKVSQWKGILPVTGDYYIQLQPVDGVPESDYKLDISLSGSGQPTPSASPTQAPSSTPTR